MLRSDNDLYAGTETFTPLGDEDALAEALSGDGATVLFLDDPFCPISAHARREMQRAEIPARVVDVARRSNLSRAIEERTGIRHESPQVIVLAGGHPIWSASHFGITADAVARAVAIAEDLPGVQG
jgi:bacillithiol system protein YtxJ